MSVLLNRPRFAYTRTYSPKRNVSLSTYFPKGTQYFYGYPSGEDSGFLNLVPPSVEELVAERAISCAGEHVSVVGFAAIHHPLINEKLLDTFNIPRIKKEQLILLPKSIHSGVKGAERNQVIKESLLNLVDGSNLVMAQPYTSADMNGVYQLPSKLISYLNNKNHMSQYIDNKMLPKRLGTYKNGEEFSKAGSSIKLPFVVKASSSSCGDGVYICRTDQDIQNAIDNLKSLKSVILIEQYIEAVKNYGFHFGIPSNAEQSIDFLGINEQITTDKGEFIGGIINSSVLPKELVSIKDYLIDEILPEVRTMGWYGVGGFDVLLDADGHFYFIDCNFRMTGMSAYHFLVANRIVNAPLISFSGELRGSQSDLMNSLMPFAGGSSKRKTMQMIALSRQKDLWTFNAALFFDNHKQLNKLISDLFANGVTSKALEHISQISTI